MLYSYVLLCGFRFTYVVHRTCIFIRWILDFKYILLLLLLLLLLLSLLLYSFIRIDYVKSFLCERTVETSQPNSYYVYTIHSMHNLKQSLFISVLLCKHNLSLYLLKHQSSVTSSHRRSTRIPYNRQQ